MSRRWRGRDGRENHIHAPEGKAVIVPPPTVGSIDYVTVIHQ